MILALTVLYVWCLDCRWSLIAGRLPGRTDNEVKNYWNSHLRRKLISMGIDPNNHRLSHRLPPHRHQHVSNSATSSGSKSQVCEPYQQVKSQGDNDQVSDACSCLKDDACALPDLNLELTTTTSSPPLTTASEMKQHHEPQASPTLLLFIWFCWNTFSLITSNHVERWCSTTLF